MKRFLMLLTFVFTSIFSFTSVAANVVVSSNFFTLINDVETPPVKYEGTSTQWVLKYSYSLEDDFYYYFSSSNPVVDAIGGVYLSVSPYSDWNQNFRGQCVGFVKVVTNGLLLGETKYWGKGDPFNASTPPVKGTVLAFFDNQPTYPVSTGHVLVYWGKVGNVHYVIDQNWGENGTDKKIRKHPMSEGSGRNNLNNYHIVTK